MDKRINCNNCPLCHVEVDTYCEQYCSDMADFIDETRADAIDEFAEKLADGIEGFEVDFPNCKNVSVCTLDGVVEKIFEIAEALKEQNNDSEHL